MAMALRVAALLVAVVAMAVGTMAAAPKHRPPALCPRPTAAARGRVWGERHRVRAPDGGGRSAAAVFWGGGRKGGEGKHRRFPAAPQRIAAASRHAAAAVPPVRPPEARNPPQCPPVPPAHSAGTLNASPRCSRCPQRPPTHCLPTPLPPPPARSRGRAARSRRSSGPRRARDRARLSPSGRRRRRWGRGAERGGGARWGRGGGGSRSGGGPGPAPPAPIAMGEWTILERLLEAAVQQHSTMIGRILLTVVVIFRILIVAIVGETVYEDEQTMFMCNTLQPGCNQACYDKAFPISHIRYWVFQIILVCTPSLCFITYSVHQAAKQRERRYSFLYPLLERDAKKARTLNGVLAPGADGGTKDEPECLEAKELPSTPPRRAKAKRQEGISRFYVIQVVFRNALEIGFLAGQYFLYGFNVPAIFECDRYPCVKEVECYVSRPTEKTVFLVFMFAVSGICVLLNLAELNHLGWRKVKAAVRGVQARRKSLVEVRKKDGAALTPAPTLGRTQSSESAYV
ncbi:gap junction delta-2 protein-like [Gallus gallus]|uniref:gap junction delta-2 protein-like n=1 Tax=Gallus gallus TaxID=9031 RepID=UPI001AEA6A55|nr:gap junction delta-2 protein-like [Gallus gallus]